MMCSHNLEVEIMNFFYDVDDDLFVWTVFHYWPSLVLCRSIVYHRFLNDIVLLSLHAHDFPLLLVPSDYMCLLFTFFMKYIMLTI
jgi:hypothetical protein